MANQNTKEGRKSRTARTRADSERVGERQLSKLRRHELLQILVSQSREIDRLKNEITRLQDQLNDRRLKISSCGTLADASLAVFDVLESAQKAADLYLENIKRMAGSDEPEQQAEASGQKREAEDPQPESGVRGQE